MNSAIYNFIDEIFASKDGNPEIFKLNAFAEREPLTDAFDFVNSDYYSDDGSDYLFSWTGKEYYENHKHQSFGARLINEAPIVEILDYERIKKLDSYFGDLWKPAFKKWFIDKTKMDYKTLYTE